MGRPFTDDAERGQATAALADASDMVRAYGNPYWNCACDDRKVVTPRAVRAVALAMAERRMRNPENFVSEGAGEYQYRYAENGANGAAPSKAEIALMEKLSNKNGRLQTPVVERNLRINSSYMYPYGASEANTIGHIF
ncbi:hypothetical protein [Streptomyces sp. NPDC056883]|uniref:hypothetical protein n=1 Tax=Streptomyces sp. NPDC056883 TaxID=3345959 RepID=UPI00367E7AF8